MLIMNFKLTWCVKMKLLKTVNKKKVLTVTIDNKLNFATHLVNITKNASCKFNTLTRVQKCMITVQKSIIFSSFMKSQFFYCPLIWIFCTKVSIGRISNIHERCLHFIQQNYTSDLEILLKDANEKPIIPTRFLGYSKPFMQLYVTKYRVRLYLLLWSP